MGTSSKTVSFCHDLTSYGIEVSNCSLNSNCLIYTPTRSIRNYIFLDIVKRKVSNDDGNVLVIAPSDYVVNLYTQFLRRHLETVVISCKEENEIKNEGSLPKVILGKPCNLFDIMESELISTLKLIIVLECHDICHNDDVKMFIARVTELEIENQPFLHCFTSSLCVSCDTISQNIQVLEEFYGCKLISVCDQHTIESIFPAPVVLFSPYEKLQVLSKPCVNSIQLLMAAHELCTNLNLKLNDNFERELCMPGDEFVKRALFQIQEQMEELGQYGGSIATLAAFRHLVCVHTFTDISSGHTSKHLLGYLVCALAQCRKVLEEDMKRIQLCERAEHFSSEKVQMLLHHLRTMPERHQAIIIVEKPSTASNLTLLLKKIVTHGKKYTHLKPGLMIDSYPIPFSHSWEDTLSWERNMDVYSSFVSGTTNALVFSGDLQGLDMPQCDLVFVFGRIQSLSFFLQVKNLVKKGSGKLILLIDKPSEVTYKEQIYEFESAVTELTKLVRGDSLKHGNNQLQQSPFITPLGLEISGDFAIFILQRYCSILPSEKLTPYRPVWKMRTRKSPGETTLYRASLFLPRICPINKIKGEEMTSWEVAQKNAAIRACQELYSLREIDDCQLTSWWQSLNNIPQSQAIPSTVNHKSDSEFQLDVEVKLGLHPLSSLNNDTVSPDEEDFLCDIAYPSSLSCALPRNDEEFFIHKLKILPVSECPSDDRKAVLYELLCDESSFAILSTKPLFQISQFPIFMFGHELAVEIETLKNKLKLDRKDIVRLGAFHYGLFANILSVVQGFMEFGESSSHNSYLIAPLTSDAVIDWNTVDNHKSLPECRELNEEEKSDLICSRETHERTIVKPWYRRDLAPDEVYLVTKVCEDMSAESCFPTEDFDSFLDYYETKYGIILVRPELPLLEVYILDTKDNGLLPRALSIKFSRDEKKKDFREHFVPELCMPLLFPAKYWLKLQCLPYALHRLSRFIVVEELRRLLFAEAGVGTQNMKVEKLSVDPSRIQDTSSIPKVPPSLVKRGLSMGNVKLEDRKRSAQLKKPWQMTQEPVDIHRHLEFFNFVEIRYYREFLMASRLQYATSCQSPTSPELQSSLRPELESNCWDSIDLFSHGGFDLLKPCSDEDTGPQQYELLEVFTSTSSKDVVNMDRIQVLGNAFLKLVISVYTFQHGSKIPGSKTLACLNKIRSVFLSQKNLENCSVKKDLCGRLKVLDFTAGEWIPPCFYTPPWLKDVLIDQDISPNVLQHINFNYSPNKILDILSKFDNVGTARREEVYIDRQHVPRETAAGCVEALVGTYFKNCGWQGALKVIGWLELLPVSKLSKLLDCEEAPEKVSIASQFAYLLSKIPKSLESLELCLHYNFNDKTLLIQAVTHESYVNPAFKGSMDTLAFLGIGVIDFLLTSYIFERFYLMSASQLGQLREILTSTATLAFLAVRFGIHKHLLSHSSSLLDAIDRFVQNQKGCQHSIDDEVQLLLEEHECENVLQVEVPNALAKLIPSLVGAVYLDSFKSLQATWNAFAFIFMPWIEKWSQVAPLAVIDLLKDLSPAAHQVLFSSETDKDGTVEVTCRIQMDNTREEVFIARGSNEIKTETHAAKLALRNLIGFKSFSS